MKMWHVPDADDEEDGYIVLASSPKEAKELVMADLEESLAAHNRERRAGRPISDVLHYIGGKWPQWDKIHEVGPVFRIPFLGYTW